MTMINAGDPVLYRVAIDGGWMWRAASVTAKFPIGWGSYRYDVLVDGRIVHRVSELSLRAVAPQAA